MRRLSGPAFLAYVEQVLVATLRIRMTKLPYFGPRSPS